MLSWNLWHNPVRSNVPVTPGSTINVLFTLSPFWFSVYSSASCRRDEGFMTFLWHEGEIINSDLSFRTLSEALPYLFSLIVSGCYENPFYIATHTRNHKQYRSGSWIYSFLVFIQPMAVTMWLNSSGKRLGIWECWIGDFCQIPFIP